MTLGTLLREQRQRLGLDLAEVAVYLNIRLPYLEAIENDSYDQLPPGNAYRVGFIKSYASTLELDGEKAVALFRKEQAHAAGQNQPLKVRMPIAESRVPTFSLVFIVLALFAGGWIGWAYLHRSDRTLADEVPNVPDRLQSRPAAQEAQASQPVAAPENAAPALTQAAAPVPDPHPLVAQAPPPQPAPTVEAEPDEAHDETYNRDTQSPAFHFLPAQPGSTVPPGNSLGASGPSRVVVEATADSWVQISGGGKIAFKGVLHAGDSYHVPDQPGWTMIAGNAGGISLMIDGTRTGPLGGAGQVIRNVALDPVKAAASR